MFHSRIFTTLKFQESPKVFWLERLLGKKIFLAINQNTIELKSLPELYQPAKTVIRVRGKQIILFEKTETDELKVFRFNGDSWKKDVFYGYPVIEKYTVEELNSKFNLVRKVLEENISNCLTQNQCLHGDFTHFNALISHDNKLNFIDLDNTTRNKSVHYDFIHFIIYLMQGIYRTTVLNKKEKKRQLHKIVQLFNELNCKHFGSRLTIQQIRAELVAAPGIQKDSFDNILSFFN